MTHSNQTIPSTDGSGSKALLNPEMSANTFDMRGQGVFEKVLDVPGFRGPGAMVLGAVTEYSPVTGKPIMGSAVITLHSVVPLDGPHVQVRVESRWPEELAIRVQLMWFL